MRESKAEFGGLSGDTLGLHIFTNHWSPPGVAQNIRQACHGTPRSRNVCEIPGNRPSLDGCTSRRASNSLATRSVTSPPGTMYQRRPSLLCIVTSVPPARIMSAALEVVMIGFRFLVAPE